VWALQEYGFRAVIAPSFADIFFGNCFKNGVLPIALAAEIVDELFAQVADGLQLHIDLDAQTVAIAQTDRVFDFAVDPALKQKMLQGMDDIDMTLAERGLIETFEKQHRDRQPWLFRD
jgi:3-isopropylmalate/(R)-2-methylmalate dehydratase small subunit